jgi:hypothetical protein
MSVKDDPMSRSLSQPAIKPQNIGQYPIRPLTALRAFRLLVQDKEDTVQVFRIIRALAGKSLSNGYLKLLRTPEGGRQAYLAEELADKLPIATGSIASSPERSARAIANSSRCGNCPPTDLPTRAASSASPISIPRTPSRGSRAAAAMYTTSGTS